MNNEQPASLLKLIGEHTTHGKVDRAAYEKELLEFIKDPEKVRKREEDHMRMLDKLPRYTNDISDIRHILFKKIQ